MHSNSMEKKTFYVTRSKLEELKKEYADLVAQEKEKTVTEEAPKILESDDMNPEFASFQEDMGAMRARIDELRHILDHHEIIGAPAKNEHGQVAIGASIKVDSNGDHDNFTIVGTLEANPTAGLISNESPVGRALLGKKVGDEVLVPSPVGKTYKIKSIKYDIA